ncbi:MAG: hypothetical protein D9V47_03350 [Clostridia bacterium]|nr:MAG: hypothetical protein D9V47_03350 [Clostridia bacterium]
MTRRQAIGFELNPAWVKIYEEIKAGFMVQDGQLVEADNRPRPNRATSGEWLPRQKDPGPAGSGPGTKGSGTSQLATQSGTWPITGEMRQGDCLELLKELGDESVEVVVTDPPYGAQHGATGFAAETNFNMLNAGETADFGNAPDFETYLELMHRFGLEAHRVLKPQKYLIIMVGDRFRAGEYVPLGYLVAEEMRRVGFRFKGLKIWSNKATQRPLKPYAVLSSFVPNITHQNILILKKE